MKKVWNLGSELWWRQHRSNETNVVLDAWWAEGVWLDRCWGTTHHRICCQRRVFLKCVLCNADHWRNDGVESLLEMFEQSRGRTSAPLLDGVPPVVLPRRVCSMFQKMCWT